MRKLIASAITLLFFCAGWAQVPLDREEIRPTKIAPKYFGPYAYPVPDLDEAKTSGQLSVYLSGDFNIGNIGGKGNEDYTWAPSYRISVPLWTDRVNFVSWGNFHEWWTNSEQSAAARRINPKYPLKGEANAQVWLGLDMLILRETEKRPSVVLSANMLTAMGEYYDRARYYDAAGYHFTASTGKDFAFKDDSRLRASVTLGFVCWQTKIASQNDAFLCGLKLSYTRPFLVAAAEYGTYTGWEGDGDQLRVLKLRADVPFGRFSPFFAYAHGFHDWPFDQFRLGLQVNFDILKYGRAK